MYGQVMQLWLCAQLSYSYCLSIYDSLLFIKVLEDVQSSLLDIVEQQISHLATSAPSSQIFSPSPTHT